MGKIPIIPLSLMILVLLLAGCSQTRDVDEGFHTSIPVGDYDSINQARIEVGGIEPDIEVASADAMDVAMRLVQLPPRPVMRLGYAGQVHDGAEGTYCWPDSRMDDGSVMGVCADKIRWSGLSTATLVEQGSELNIKVEAQEQPQALAAIIYERDSGTRVRFLDLGSGPELGLVADVPTGIYNMAVFGIWPDGDITYEFRMEVH